MPRTARSGTAGLGARKPIRVLISGASGTIGTELSRQLRESGDEVFTLVRRQPRNDSEINWAPSARTVDYRIFDSIDAVVNLSGASLARLPWTPGWKRQILDSRVKSTQALAEAMNMAATPPSVFISGSAVGFYGDRPAERLTESSAIGTGFLPEVVLAWEQAAQIAPEKTRVVTIRTGIVVGKGGVLAPLQPLTKLGLGSRFGQGGQHWPWISLHDEVAAIRHLIDSKLSGPVNLVGPTSATSDRLTSALAERLRRPYAFVIPEWLISTVMGTAGRELILTSEKVIPQRLLEDGFVFTHPTVESAIDDMLAG